MPFSLQAAAKEAEQKVVAEMAENGSVTAFEFGEEFQTGKMTIQEMIGTDSGAKEFVEKIVYDLSTGRDRVPLLYKSIYGTLTDENFPEVMTEKSLGLVQTVFLEKFEGGEIKFGSVGRGQEATVRMHTWSSGIEYDEDVVVYNQTWRVGLIGESFGESFNHLLNHLHLSPIIEGTYAAATAKDSTTSTIRAAKVAQKGTADTDGAAQSVSGGIDDAATWRTVQRILPRGSIILCNSFDEQTIRDAIQSDVTVVGNTNEPGAARRALSNATYVAYDGETITVGDDVYEYAGVPAGVAYVIAPTKRNFKEYIKHDLRVDGDNGDLSRLILSQVVGRARRGLVAGLGGEHGVVKVVA